MRGGGWARWVAAAALCVLAAGCGGTVVGPGTTLSIAPDWVSATCPAPQGPVAFLGLPPNGGGIPSDFHVAWVLRCGVQIETLPGRGQWTVQTTERADTSARDLVAALRQPSAPPPTPALPCAAPLQLVNYFALVDASGHALVPKLPMGVCGVPLAAVTKALAALPFRTISSKPLNQVLSEPAQAAGCPAAWKDLPDMRGTGHPGSGPAWPTTPASITVCEYQRTSSGPLATGKFSSARTVTGAAVTTLADALAQAGPAAPCTASNTRFAVLMAQQSSWLIVELDGCQRLQRSDGTLSQLQPSTIKLVTGVG